MSGRTIHLEILGGGSGRPEARNFDADGGPIVIGRDEECTIPLAAQAISRRHATIEPAPDGWVLTDHSTLGTTLNDEPMENEKPTLLADGDTIGLHETIIRVALHGGRSASDDDGEYAGDLMRIVDEIGKEEERAGRIEVFQAGRPAGGVGVGEEGSSLLIGRSAECDLRIDDPLRLVSGVHARVEREWAGAFLYDLSRNGLYVNGRKVEDCAPLADGDRITLALQEERPDGIVLVYIESEGAAEPAAPAEPEAAEESNAVQEEAAGPAATPEPDGRTAAGGGPAVSSGAGKETAAETRGAGEPPEVVPPAGEPPAAGGEKRGDGKRRTAVPAKGTSPAGQGAFLWIVIAVVVVVIAAFAIIGVRVMGG